MPDESSWTLVLPRSKLGPHRQHYFELENVDEKIYTHVKVTIYPDGGLKRIRVTGRKVEPEPVSRYTESEYQVADRSLSHSPNSSSIITVPVVPLTAEAYKPFGQVIQAYDPKPDGVKVTPANGGTAAKFHKLSLLTSSYTAEAGASTGISVYRCQPLEDIENGVTALKNLERHPFTSQAFIPMGSGVGKGLAETADSYLVVVALNGSDDRPDMKTLRAFVASTAQGISYNAGIWRKYFLHHPCSSY